MRIVPTHWLTLWKAKYAFLREQNASQQMVRGFAMPMEQFFVVLEKGRTLPSSEWKQPLMDGKSLEERTSKTRSVPHGFFFSATNFGVSWFSVFCLLFTVGRSVVADDDLCCRRLSTYCEVSQDILFPVLSQSLKYNIMNINS